MNDDFFSKAFGSQEDSSVFDFTPQNPDTEAPETAPENLPQSLPPAAQPTPPPENIEQEDDISSLGSRTIETYLLTKKCRACEKMNEENANYCSRCGTKFEPLQPTPGQHSLVFETTEELNRNPSHYLLPENPQPQKEKEEKKVHPVCCFSPAGLLAETRPQDSKRYTKEGVTTLTMQGEMKVTCPTFFPASLMEDAPFPPADKKELREYIENIVEHGEIDEDEKQLWKYAGMALDGKEKNLEDLFGSGCARQVSDRVFTGLNTTEKISRSALESLCRNEYTQTHGQSASLLSLFLAVAGGPEEYKKWMRRFCETKVEKEHPLRLLLFSLAGDTDSIKEECRKNEKTVLQHWVFIVSALLNTHGPEDTLAEISAVLKRNGREASACLCLLLAERTDLLEHAGLLFGESSRSEAVTHRTVLAFQLTEIFEHILKEKKKIEIFHFMAYERERMARKLAEAGMVGKARQYCVLCVEQGLQNNVADLKEKIGAVSTPKKHRTKSDSFWSAVDNGISKIIGIEDHTEETKNTFKMPSVETEKEKTTEDQVREPQETRTERDHQEPGSPEETPGDTGSILGRFKGLFGMKGKQPKSKEADLGEESSFRYDKKLGRWVSSDPALMEEEKKMPEIPPVHFNTDVFEEKHSPGEMPLYFDYMNQSKH
ncbi:MAG: uncharacterized protein A8A55_0001 [Amphiamblys sp. WSBS2006]|nr:MAG: uncharacterized protein A8A55_0001 [Amphiamblys sp. WSBS2006]